MKERIMYEKYKGRFFLLEDVTEGFNKNTLEISNEDYASLIEATSIIHKFKYFKRKELELQLNYDEYFKAVELNGNWLEKEDTTEYKVSFDKVFVDINRVFINFITSLKVLIEHTEGRIKKRFKEDSKEFSLFKKFTREVYDKYFSYRLFILLRDYSIHHGYPIKNISHQKTIDKSSVFSICFNKIELLKNKRVKSKLGADLERYNDLFPVEPLMYEIQKVIRLVVPKIIEIEKEFYRESAELTLQYYNSSKSKRNVCFGYVMYNGRENKVGWMQTALEIETSNLILNN